ncbi:MAG TPA: purine-nucleoside phosphorylase [Desulfobacteraceae bacterium]|nr:purine-nucleoside phosphorylase [Desulfobacteraceae bacterium]
MIAKINETLEFLKKRVKKRYSFGFILGTGLGQITDIMDIEDEISYEEIPNFPVSTVEGHRGRLVFGSSYGKSIVAMDGRFHLYEGYSGFDIALPIRAMKSLGVEYLMISSAAGGLNPKYVPGDLMILRDHINLTGHNPLVGPNVDEFGPRFPDMARPYDQKLIEIAKKKANDQGIDIKEGVYVQVLGPSLETAAESRFLRMIGADAVGMSTVVDVIVGIHCGMKILVIVVITDVIDPDNMQELTLEDVLKTAQETSPKLCGLWKEIIKEI